MLLCLQRAIAQLWSLNWTFQNSEKTRSAVVTNSSQGLCNFSILSLNYRCMCIFCKNSSQAPLTLSVSSQLCPLSRWPCWVDNEAATPPQYRVLTGIKWGSELPAHHTIISIVWSWVASNPCALACNIWWVSEWVSEVFSVKTGVAARPVHFPQDRAPSMHQWHQSSQGTCRMPDQWFIRTQLAGRHGAACHMPPGSTAICTHSPLLLYPGTVLCCGRVLHQRRATVCSSSTNLPSLSH